MEQVTSIAAIAVVVGITQIAKGFLSDRVVPIIALVVGVGVSYLISLPPLTHAVVIFNGLVFGLSAMGLYSGTKTLKKTS